MTSDVDPTLVYSIKTTTPKATTPAESFSKSISMNEFMEDLRLRFPTEFDKAIQTWIYFYTDEDTQTTTKEFVYGLNKSVRTFVTFRPAMISFISVNPGTNKIGFVIKTKGLEVYSVHGIQFETHISKRVWDDDRKKYTRQSLLDKDGNPIYRREKELRINQKVNLLKVQNQKKHFQKEKSEWDIIEQHVDYYKWHIDTANDDSKPVQFMVQNIIRTDKFVPLNDKLDKLPDDDDQIEITFDVE